MVFEGLIHPKKKDEKYHLVEIPDLEMATQGKDLKSCHRMIKDALESLFEEYALEVKVMALSEKRFLVKANNLKPLLARFLRVQRERKGLSLQDVAERLGYSSRSSYAQYEQGKSLPSLEKLSEFLSAINPEEEFFLATTRLPAKKVS